MSPLLRFSSSLASTLAAADSRVCSPWVETLAANKTSLSDALERTSSTVTSLLNLISDTPYSLAPKHVTEGNRLAAGAVIGDNCGVPFETRIAIIAALVLTVLVAGLLWRIRTGRAKRVKAGEQVDLQLLGAIKNGQPVSSFGKRVTFLQFSSEMCSQCAQTARVFKELESNSDDILHIEVDITNRLDLARKFQILQTPTTLVLDHTGRVTSRIGGVAKPQTIQDEIGHFTI